MKNKNALIVAGIVLAVAAGMFYGGMEYGKTRIKIKEGDRQQAFFSGDRQSRRDPGMRINRGEGGGDFVAGEVTAKDEKSITIKMRDAGSRIIFFSDSTSVGKTVEGSIADINSGQQVMVSGKMNQDETFTADNIQIRPLPPQENAQQENIQNAQ